MYESSYHIVRPTSHKNYRFQGSRPFFKIIREIAEETDVDVKVVGFIIYFFLEKVATRAAHDGEIYLEKFGKFIVSKRSINDWEGNKRTTKTMRFIPSEPLKKYINSLDKEDDAHNN